MPEVWMVPERHMGPVSYKSTCPEDVGLVFDRTQIAFLWAQLQLFKISPKSPPGWPYIGDVEDSFDSFCVARRGFIT